MFLRKLLLAIITIGFATTYAIAADDDYKESAEYITLRDSLHHAFNDGDSARFFIAVKALEDYLLQQNDLHAYYTQRCNEIVFQLNRQRIFEAYRLATQLSKELTERKLDKEMYMAINMMGHIYRYCGNKEAAKRCFLDVIKRMEDEGYKESQPPIYMNLVNIAMDQDPHEALALIDKALSIARETSPQRVFDIEARRTLAYYYLGDMERFLEGYKSYRAGIDSGYSTVHARTLEVYYLTSQGRIEEAIQQARKGFDDDRYSTLAEIYATAGRWKEAYEVTKAEVAANDSLNSVILSGNMEGIQNELRLYETKQQAARRWLYALIAIACLLLLLVVALVYIVHSRRRHLHDMSAAYEHALESDRLKTAFIQNVSHEVRTPLNVISGFAQVMADPDSDISLEERSHIADTMMRNTTRITTMINQMLEMSVGEASVSESELTKVHINETLTEMVNEFCLANNIDKNIIEITTTFDDSFTIVSHKRTLRRTLTPLLDNAVKNTPNGEHVLLHATADTTTLTITVTDHGQGIPQEETEHIFERFVKLDSFKDGLGLGLPMSRTMASRLGGTVCYDTTYTGKGSRFVVQLPLKQQTVR